MTSPAGPTAVFGLAGLESTVSGITMSTERVAHLKLPETLTDEHLSRISKDLEILSDVVSNRGSELAALHEAVIAQDPKARQIARDVGLAEEDMIAKGGGIVLLVVAIAVAAALLLESDSPPPPPPPPPDPPSSDGGSDAGTG